MEIDVLQLKDVVGYTAVVVTIGLFLSGITICHTIWHKQSTVGVSPLPFLTATISCSLWTCYGLQTKDTAIFIVNFVGLLLQIIYIVFYYYMCTNKVEIQKKIVGVIVFIFGLLFIVYSFRDNEKNMISILGFMSSTASILFMASPLSNIVMVFHTQSTESMPFTLIAVSFLMAFLWFVYGILIKDYVVQIPNLIGTCVTAFQLLLFAIFRRGPLIP